MSVPNHTIVPVTEDDVPTIAGFLQASKPQLAIYRFLFKDWPKDSAQLAQYTGAVESGFEDPLFTTLKVVDDRSGETVAHLAFARRKARVSEAEVSAVDEADGHRHIPNFFVIEVFSTMGRTVRELDQELEGIEHIRQGNRVPCSPVDLLIRCF